MKKQQMTAMVHNPRSMSSDLTSASTCKSDILLLQMHQQKLSQKYRAHQHQEPASICSLNQQLEQFMQQSQVVGDREIQIAVSECQDVDTILMQNQYQNEHDAIQKMALRIRLMQLVESQMQQMEHVVVEMMHSCSNKGPLGDSKTSLSRIPTFLTLIDQCADVALNTSLNQQHAAAPKQKQVNNNDNHPKFPPILSPTPVSGPLKSEPVNTGDDPLKFKQQLEKSQKENQILKHMKKLDVRKFQHELVQLHQEKDNWCAKYNNVAQQLEKGSREIQHLTTANAALESQIETFKTQHLELNENQKTLQDTIKQKTQQYNDSQQQLSEQHQQLNTSKSQYSSLQCDFQSVQNTLSDANQSLHDEYTLRQALEKNFDRAQLHIQKWKNLLQVPTTSDSDDEIVDHLSHAISGLQSSYAKQTMTLTCVQQAFETCQDQLDQLVKEKENVEHQLQQTIDVTESQRVSLQEKEKNIERCMQDQILVWENMRSGLEDQLGEQKQEEKQMQYQLQVERDSNHTLKLNFKSLQQEKRDWMKSKIHAEEETITADTYEEVMKEEFEVMQQAFLQRIKAAEAQVANQQKEAQEERQALLEQHKKERCRFAMQLNTMKK